ncbi:flagellar basal body-associated FliL family protein [Paracoccus sp. TK19116]|uniref:Flagellar protein FliL n=1 Tax=Paracoccus albicereus TaxID=2922394 RepID=A0ABT1MSC1_9RHOB|nr:flagellar basal body-associated FliL family protein [Paracoccus albicereus]MCQ0971049.1 flagellar basal body-associated FliL family protein [Paracoccus albicereus]
MTEPAPASPESSPRKKGKLIPLLLTAMAALGGFGAAYTGLWSAMDLLSPAEARPHDEKPVAEFVAVPVIDLTLQGARSRNLVLAAMIETTQDKAKDIEHTMPRVSDAFNGFLSGIDPAAFDKRGVLEIVRAELLTRSRAILGDEVVHDLLITEFRLK